MAKILVGISLFGLVAGSVDWCQPGLGTQLDWCWNSTRNSYDIPQQGGLDLACLLEHNHGLGSFRYGQEFNFPFECCQNNCDIPFCSFHPRCKDPSGPETTTVTVTPSITITQTSGQSTTSYTTYIADSSTFTYTFGTTTMSPVSGSGSASATSNVTSSATPGVSTTPSQGTAGSGSGNATSVANAGGSGSVGTVSSSANATAVTDGVSTTTGATSGSASVDTASASSSAASITGAATLPSPSGTTLYIFSSKYNTSQDTFNAYVKDLDGGAGFLISYDGKPWQTYQTNLTNAQVEDVAAQPWLDYIQVVPPADLDADYEDSRAVRPTTDIPVISDEDSTAPLAKRAIAERDPTDASQLKLISASYPVPQGQQPDFSQNYRFDDSLGSGNTIYIVDTGFNLAVPDLKATGRAVTSFTVPNQLTLPQYWQGPLVLPDHTDTALAEDITDVTSDTQNEDGSYSPGRGHGTGVASAAAGLTYGVASKANLYLIKAKNGFTRHYTGGQAGKPDRVYSTAYQLGAVSSALNEIMYDVGLNALYAKSVVNFSWGTNGGSLPVNVGSGWYNEMQKFLQFADSNGIVVVCSAGNKQRSPAPYMGGLVPQRLGTDDNNLISVGGLNKDATFWDGTLPEGSANFQTPGEGTGANPGSISIYAQATDVTKWTKLDVDTTEDMGTSYASPQVAGIAAYFLSHPPSGGPAYQPGTVSRQMKTDLQSYAYAYTPNYPSANNGARSPDLFLCSRDADSGCNTAFQWNGSCTYVNVVNTFDDYSFHIDELAEPEKCATQLPQYEACLEGLACTISGFNATCQDAEYPNGVSGSFVLEASCDSSSWALECFSSAFGYVSELNCTKVNL